MPGALAWIVPGGKLAGSDEIVGLLLAGGACVGGADDAGPFFWLFTLR